MPDTDTLPPPNAEPATIARRLLTAISPVLRVLLAGVFLYAAYNKLVVDNGPEMFGQSIKAFELNLPDALVQWAMRAVPVTEVLLSVLLIVGLWTRSAALAMVMLLAFFDLLIMSAIARDLSLSCGCFGKQRLVCEGVGWCKVIENSVLMLIAMVLALTPRHAVSIDAWRARNSARPSTD